MATDFQDQNEEREREKEREMAVLENGILVI